MSIEIFEYIKNKIRSVLEEFSIREDILSHEKIQKYFSPSKKNYKYHSILVS